MHALSKANSLNRAQKLLSFCTTAELSTSRAMHNEPPLWLTACLSNHFRGWLALAAGLESTVCWVTTGAERTGTWFAEAPGNARV